MRFFLFLFAVVSLSNYANSQNLGDIYQELPDVSQCKPGVLKQANIDLVIQKVNQIRTLHKLPPVDYDIASQQSSMEGCLNIVASGKSGHIDDPSSECYTAAGGSVRMKSNLFAGSGSPSISYSSEDIIIGWLFDDHNADKQNEYKVGHRRALLNPFLKKFSFGRADGYTKSGNDYFVAANFLYQDFVSGTASMENDYVAYPYQDYPIDFFNKDFYLSFNVVADKNSVQNNKNVNFDGVQITMKDEDGNNINVNSVASDNEGWGSYPNNVSWKALGLTDNKKYYVDIKNVNVNGAIRNYSYWFRLTNIDHSKIPNVPLQISPLNGSNNIKINAAMSWEAVQNAAYYKLQLAEDAQMNKIVANVEKQYLNGYSATNLKFNTKYYWRVCATNDAGTSAWSPVWSFTTSDSKPITPTLESPTNLSITNSTTPNLKWSDVASAESYMVQVSIDEGFSGFNVKYSKSVATNNIEIPQGILQIQTKYYWRVMSKNSSGNSEWSTVWSFNTGTALPIVKILYPLDNDTNIPIAPELKWEAIEGANSYQIQLNFSNNFENGAIINELNWKDNVYQVPINLFSPNTKYYWRVRANGNNGNGEWNQISSFTTENQISSVSKINNKICIKRYNNIINISSPDIINQIRLVNYLGKEMLIDSPIVNDFNLDMNLYPNGIYFIFIRNINNEFINYKIIKY